MMALSPTIGIIDFGSGNIKSIMNMVDKAGGDPVILSNPSDIGKADSYILPGVGAFDHVINLFRNAGWELPLEKILANTGKPVLGVCVGMQMMCNSSEEGQEPGLGWFSGKVRKFSREEHSQIRVPHVGWNDINVTQLSKLFEQREMPQRFYFTHSYFVALDNREHVAATCHYAHEFDVVLENGSLMGVQFHPEKSHFFGLEFFKRFVALSC